MKNFRAIRTAVILGQVIIMMIQPMVMASVGSGCGDAQCSETPVCGGCGCCEVAEAESSCCCCSTPDESPSKPDDSQNEKLDQEVVVADSAESVFGLCLCGLTVPPMDRGNERASERIDVRQYECLTIALPLDAYRPSHGLKRPVSFSESIPSPRFSQRQLCVWRI